MIDIKVLAIHDLLTVSKIDYAHGIQPLSLVITGEKFTDATKVLINDLEAPEYIVVADSRIVAQVPDTERDSVIRKVVVLAEAPSPRRSSILSFEIGDSFKSLSGLERLVQTFCKLLLQTPGSDKFDKEKGGGLQTLIGRNVSKHDTGSIKASVVGAVNRTRDQVLALQGQNRRIPADERLLTARVDAVGFDPSTTSVTVRVAIAAVSGRAAVANLTF